MTRASTRPAAPLAASRWLPLALALLCSCAQAGPAPVPPARPALVLLLVVDGLPMRQVLSYRAQLQPDGLRRFLDQGSWFAQAHYGHAHTVTAAGHATMLTGAYPQRSGIISNEWVDPRTGAPVYNTMDAEHRYIGHPTPPLAGTSPRMLLAETVGDVLRQADPAAKVIAISGKDRGAILTGGHRGTAYIYMGGSGQFASSTYYMQSHPAWVTRFNAAKPADAFFGKAWTALLPEAAYAGSVPDGQPWQSNAGNGHRLPAVLGAGMDAPGPRFYGNLMASPYGDALTLAFARAAIEGEDLGRDASPDILSVSLSSHDHVNHAFGPESRLSHDHLLQLDRQLQDFFHALDARLGKDRYLAVLTADHGFADTPEWARLQGRDSVRIPGARLQAVANSALSEAFGEGRWVTALSAMGLLFDEALIAARGLAPATVYAEARRALMALPDVEAVYTPQALADTAPGAPLLEQVRKSWHPERAAPVQVVMKEGRLFGTLPVGSSHGTPWPYDTHVPILTWGPAWVGQGEVAQRVEVADIAPTLAAILGLRVPAQSQGRRLPLPLPQP